MVNRVYKLQIGGGHHPAMVPAHLLHFLHDCIATASEFCGAYLALQRCSCLNMSNPVDIRVSKQCSNAQNQRHKLDHILNIYSISRML